jgi:hypothetical protein
MTEPAVLLQAAKLAENKGDREVADRFLNAILVEHPWSEETAIATQALEKGSETARSPETQDAVTRIRVVDVDIPFTSMVWLLGKAAFAIVPAGIVAWFFWEALSTSLPVILADAVQLLL